MKAVRVITAGPPEAVEIAHNVSLPIRQPGEVLVKQHGSSINPLDYKILTMPSFMVKKPKILGGDVAGVIEESDPSSQYKQGDRVFGMAEFAAPWFRPGAFAEWVCIPEKHVTRIPDNISFDQAAAAPLVALTAWQALDGTELGPGKRVLIHAGAGGVGHVAIQLAKIRGAHVTTTCSASSAAFVKGIGADEAIDYKSQHFEQISKDKPFDIIMDSVGGDYNWKGLSVLKRQGHYSHIMSLAYAKSYGMVLGMLRETWDSARGSFWGAITGPSYKMIITQSNGIQLASIAQLMADGQLKIAIDRSFLLKDAALALRHLSEGHPHGKVVLQISS